jgi:hypothetical protein
LDAFKNGVTPVLVATDVAARGIHVDGISLVLHVDAPSDPKDYLHRAGRTARAGESGTVVILAAPKQQRTVSALTSRAGVDPDVKRVRPMDQHLVEVTGAREPSGEPWFPPREPARGGRGGRTTVRGRGSEEALRRAEAYAKAGADILFVESPESEAEMARIGQSFDQPLMVNMVEGGKTPVQSAAELGERGFKIVIFPGGTARAVLHMLQGYYASLHTHQTTRPWQAQMLDFDGLNAVIETPQLLALGQRYESGNNA